MSVPKVNRIESSEIFDWLEFARMLIYHGDREGIRRWLWEKLSSNIKNKIKNISAESRMPDIDERKLLIREINKALSSRCFTAEIQPSRRKSRACAKGAVKTKRKPTNHENIKNNVRLFRKEFEDVLSTSIPRREAEFLRKVIFTKEFILQDGRKCIYGCPCKYTYEQLKNMEIDLMTMESRTEKRVLLKEGADICQAWEKLREFLVRIGIDGSTVRDKMDHFGAKDYPKTMISFALWLRQNADFYYQDTFLVDFPSLLVLTGGYEKKKRRRHLLDEPPSYPQDTWMWPGLPDSLRKLAEAMEGQGQIKTVELSRVLNREPSRILSDHRTGRWKPWIDRFIGRERDKKGYFWLRV